MARGKSRTIRGKKMHHRRPRSIFAFIVHLQPLAPHCELLFQMEWAINTAIHSNEFTSSLLYSILIYWFETYSCHGIVFHTNCKSVTQIRFPFCIVDRWAKNDQKLKSFCGQKLQLTKAIRSKSLLRVEMISIPFCIWTQSNKTTPVIIFHFYDDFIPCIILIRLKTFGWNFKQNKIEISINI